MKGGILQRLDLTVRQLLPASMVLLLALLQGITWHLPRFADVVPLFPMIGVFYWSLYRPDLLLPSVAFGIGLINDILLGAPIGISSLVFLAIQGMTASQRRFFNGKSFLVIWAGFALLTAGAFLLQLLFSALLFGRQPMPRAFIVEYLMTVSAYPVLSWLFSRLQQFWLRED